MSFELLSLGFFVGLIAVLPPGPISLSLLQVSMSHGRRGGARGGLGVATGDLAMASAAGAIVMAGGMVPGWIFSGAQVLSTLVLVLFGGTLVLRPGLCRALTRSIIHPGRTFFTLTALTPNVFGAWLAVIAAMPFADHGPSVVAFVIGTGVASSGFHVFLGTAAGGFGHKMSTRATTLLSRSGGLAMLAFAAWTALG